MDFGWTLPHAADDEGTAVGSVDQGFSGSGKRSEPPRHLKSAANTFEPASPLRLMGCGHGLVQTLKCRVERAALGGETERLDPLDADLGDVGL